jgi:hypothetical protein
MVEKHSIGHNLNWSGVAFGVTLALVIGLRLDRAALTVIVGAACGILASIPTGLLIVAFLKRKNESYNRGKPTPRIAQSPHVVIVTPPGLSAGQPAFWSGTPSLPLPAQRQFAVIGEEMIEDL